MFERVISWKWSNLGQIECKIQKTFKSENLPTHRKLLNFLITSRFYP